MLRLLKRLLGRTPTPAPTGLVVAPANIPVPSPPIKVALMTTRDVLRLCRNDTLVLPGSTVTSKNNAEMKVARAQQKPPYVVCVYRGRRLLVRADSIGCYWTQTSEPIK